MINLISIRSGPHRIELGTERTGVQLKFKLFVKTRCLSQKKMLGFPIMCVIHYVLRSQKSTKKTLDVDNPDKILIRKVSQSV